MAVPGGASLRTFTDQIDAFVRENASTPELKEFLDALAPLMRRGIKSHRPALQ